MIEFLKDNWGWLIAATCIVVSVLTIMSASKRKDSDEADNECDDKFYERHGIDKDSNAA